jgi:outer membrane protein
VLPANSRLQENDGAQAVADLDVQIAEGDRWPSVAGSLSYTRSDSEFYKVYSRFDEIFNLTIGLSISFPIFDGFLTKANIERSKVQQLQLKEQRRLIEADLDGRMTGAITDAVRLQSVARLQAENVKASEEELELARERYQVGDGTELEVRDAQLAVTRARLAEVQTQAELKNALARYHHARGDLIKTYLPEERP